MCGPNLIQQHCVTFLNWMPGWLDMLLEVGGDRLATLRVVLLGGDWVRPELIRGLRKSAPGVRAAGLGGATETAVHGTICEVDDPPAHWTSVPYGSPVPEQRMPRGRGRRIRLPGLGPGRTVVLGARHRPRLSRHGPI